MKTHRVALATLVAGVFVVAPAHAQPSPPSNDNYLSSTIITQAATTGFTATQYTDVEDTTSATTQPDLFNPDENGLPFGGGGPEPLTCDGVTYGKTIWYDMHPKVDEGVELEAAGFPTAITVYQWDVNTSRIVRTVGCQVSNTALNDFVLLQELQKGKAYTVQIGGVGPGSQASSGMLDLTANFVPDHDGDGVYDPLDACRTLPGVQRFDGCPPALKPGLSWDANTTSGVRITKMLVTGLPGGSQAQLRCSCGIEQTVRLRGSSNSANATAFVGRTLPPGATVEIWATHRATGNGQFKYGAIGGYLKYVVGSSGLSVPVKRCLMPGSRVPRTKCPPGGRRPVGHSVPDPRSIG
jgi:hypothetical protein